MKPTVLFIHPGILAPIQGGGPSRTWALIEYLRAQGFRIELVTSDHREWNAEIAEKVDQLHTPARTATAPRAIDGPTMTRPNKEQFLKRFLKDKLQLFQSGAQRSGLVRRSAIQRNRRKNLEILAGKVACMCKPVAAVATYAWLAKTLDHMPPGTLRILDTIDVQHTRAALARQSGGNLEHAWCTREEEIRELLRADVLLAIQAEEERTLREMCPDRQVLCVSHAITPPLYTPSHGDGHNVLLVGNKYDPNIKGLQLFLDTVWPAVIAQRPDIHLTVCGRICDAFNEAVGNVDFVGVVPDLKPYYEQAHVVINPVTYGTGIKIKSVEALAYGRCLVCTPQGTLGLGDPDKLPMVVANLDETMASEIVSLVGHEAKRHQLEKDAYRYACEKFTPDVVYQSLRQIIAMQSSSATGLPPASLRHP